GHPSAGRHADGVALDGVDEVELGRVVHGVVVAEPLADHEEVEAVQVEGVALGAEDAGALHHQLHRRAVRQHDQPRPVGHVGVVRRRPRVVERRRRHGREVGEVHPAGPAGEVRLQQRRGGEHEGDVVHGRREPAPVGPLARPVDGAGVRAQPHREEEPPVHLLRHVRRVLRRGEAAEL
uniref:Uncharacterized protein n=1 Tax=Oryza brachyantha TaxID=4533 RepID=J3L5Q8_ORYBR